MKVQQSVAAAGVIFSLIFVGLEVRQNTVAVRGSTIQAISDQTYDFMIQMAQDEDWMRIITFLSEGGKRAREIMSAPGWQAWWHDRRHWFPRDFQDFLDGEMQRETESYRPGGLEAATAG